jgi:hypothetical protein
MSGAAMNDEIRELAKKMQAKLEGLGLPYKEIKVFGSQIHITSHCRDTAERWASLLSKFAKVYCPAKESLQEAKENKGTVLRPTMVKVWLTGARIE